jgi:hypothetical protein
MMLRRARLLQNHSYEFGHLRPIEAPYIAGQFLYWRTVASPRHFYIKRIYYSRTCSQQKREEDSFHNWASQLLTIQESSQDNT